MGDLGEFFSLVATPLFYLIVPLYFVGTSIQKARANSAKWTARLLQVASMHDLRLVSRRATTELTGSIEGFQVELGPMKSKARLQVVVSGAPLEPLAELAFHPEPATIFSKGNSDPQVGDVVFDRAVKMELPDPDPAFALLSSALRQNLKSITKNGGFFAQGRMVVRSRRLGEGQHWSSFSEEEVSELIKRALTTARLLQKAHEDPITTLLDTAKEDPNGDIQIQAVRLLDELHGDSKAAQQALTELQTDSDIAVRLEACLRGKPRDFEVVRRIVRDTSAPAALRSRAIGALPTDELGRLRRVDRNMLVERADIEAFEVLEAILKKFVLTNDTLGFDTLKRAAKRSTDRGRLAAVRLAGSQDTPHFDWLVELLDSRYPISSVGVAQALGASGNARATVHLQGLLADRETPDDLKRAARAALDRLRANLGHRGGGLSVTEKGDGRVSLVDVGDGALSRPVASPKKQSS